jgi:hypothetical protein
MTWQQDMQAINYFFLVDGHEILCYMLMAIWQDQYQFDFDEQKA